jgi:hypothetical protein
MTKGITYFGISVGMSVPPGSGTAETVVSPKLSSKTRPSRNGLNQLGFGLGFIICSSQYQKFKSPVASFYISSSIISVDSLQNMTLILTDLLPPSLWFEN